MAKTLSGTYSNGYVLADATLNPVTNLGTILFGSSVNAAALEGDTVAAWTLLNQGTINGKPANGVDLLAGGTVTNASGGWIGGGYGVKIQYDPGSVLNAGDITANPTNAAISLLDGGSATNAAGGTLS